MYPHRAWEKLLGNAFSVPHRLDIDTAFGLRAGNYEYFLFPCFQTAPSYNYSNIDGTEYVTGIA